MNNELRHKGIRASGFSLVEMMVAMVIGLIAVGAVSMVYLSSSKTAKFQSAVLRIQENGRFAVDLMSRSIRMAGYRDPKMVEEIIANQAADLLNLDEAGGSASITLSQALFPGGWLRGTRSFEDAILTYPGLKPDVDTIGFTFQGGDNIYDCQGRLVAADEFVTNMFAVSKTNDLLCVTSAVVDSGDYCTDDGSGGSDDGSGDSGSSDSDDGSGDSGSSDSDTGSSDSDTGSSDGDTGSSDSDTGSSDSASGDSGSSDSGSNDSDDDSGGSDDGGSGGSGTSSSGCTVIENRDSGSGDSGSEDSGSEDSGSSDSGSDNSDNDDSGSQDSGSEDSGSSDSGSEDSGSDESSDSGGGSGGGSVTGSGGLPGVTTVAGGAVAIVEGVEDLKIYYGIDLNADGFANQYLRANEVPDWDKVVGLRLVVLMDSVENVLAKKDKICLGCVEYKGTTDNKIRAEFQAMVSVRNFVEETGTSSGSGSGGGDGDGDTGSDDGSSTDTGSDDSTSTDTGSDDSTSTDTGSDDSTSTDTGSDDSGDAGDDG